MRIIFSLLRSSSRFSTLHLVRTDFEPPSHAHSVSVQFLSKLPVATTQRRAAILFRGSRVHFSYENEVYYGRPAKYSQDFGCLHPPYLKERGESRNMMKEVSTMTVVPAYNLKKRGVGEGPSQINKCASDGKADDERWRKY